jgi:mannose-1-phosphate guanylyltransferase/phosphomannomutase
VLFGRYGVTGLVNVDLTPEFAAKLGAAFGAMQKVGSVITVNRDLNKTSRMIKRAIIAGLPASGVNVADVENVPIPVARFYTRVTKAAGGVHVCLSPYDRRVVDVKFFDNNGMSLGRQLERDIERAFFREDFRRVYMDDIGVINTAPEVIERYRAHFYNALNVKAIRNRKFNIVVDYANASASLVLPELFAELGCTVITLNGTLDPEKMSVSRPDFERDLDILGRITGATHADFGVRFDVGGERIFVVDAQGERVSDAVFGLALSELMLRGEHAKTLVVPANAPLATVQIAAQHDAQVVRTKLDSTVLMSASTLPNVRIAADGLGHFVFPEFQPVIDGLFAVFKTVEMLAVHSTSLREVIDELPPYNVVHRAIPCPWEAKGRLMRRISEQYVAYPMERIDGIRIDMQNAWVLVQPDPDEPVCHVYAEALSKAESETICKRFSAQVEELQR